MIEIRHVTKAFGAVHALSDVCLRINPGERVGFVGTNGSGKTTLLRAILGLIHVDGRVMVGGIDVAAEPELALRSIAYIPQIAPPIEAPVGEVVAAIAALRGIDRERVNETGRRLGLDVPSVRAMRFRDLSGGTRQKLLAAIALAQNAQILAGDEPTANLDRAARAAFFEQVAARPKDSIVVLCSHRVEELVELVDRVIELDAGHVIRDAPVREALELIAIAPVVRIA